MRTILVVLLFSATLMAQILTVPNGGTGQSSLPAHAPVVGNGSSSVNTIPPGSAGQCLVSSGPNVDPVFAPCPGGSTGGGNPGGILGYPQSYGTGAVFAGVLTELIVDNFAGATINAKIAAAQAALPGNGGILTLSCTNYAAATATIALSKSNVTLRGCGGSSIANATAGPTTLNFPAGMTGILVTGANVVIEKLSLVSASGVLGTDDGIQLNGGGPKLRDVSVYHFGRDGIRFIENTDLWMLTDVNSQNNYRDGIRVDAPCSDNSIGVSIRITLRFNAGWGLNVLCGWGNIFTNTQSDNNALGAAHTSVAYNTYNQFYTEANPAPLTLFQFDAQAMYNRLWVNYFGTPQIQDNAPQGTNEIFFTATTGEGNLPAQTTFRLSTKPGAATPFATSIFSGASYYNPDMLWRDNSNGTNMLDYSPANGWKFLKPVTIGMENQVAGTLSIASGSSIYKTTITAGTTTVNTNFKLPPDNGASGSCLVNDGSGNTSWSLSCGGIAGSMIYPAAGIANSTGTTGPWGTSYNAGNPIPANMIASPLTQSTSGNAATATALAATPQQCTSGNFATGIQANGNANCSPGGGGPGPGITVPGAAGDLLFSSGSNGMQVDSGNATYDATNKVLTVPSIQLSSPTDGYVSYVAGVGNLPALAANSMGFSAPPSGGTPGLIRLPGTLSAGVLTLGAPATVNGVNQSQATVTPMAATATPNAVVQANASGTIDPSFITGSTGGSVPFSNITAGTLTFGATGTLMVGNNVTLTRQGTGNISANQINGTSMPTGAQAYIGLNASGQIVAAATPSGGGNVSAVPTPLQYQIPIWQSPTTISGLVSGNVGDVLTSAGASASPSWQPPVSGPGGGINFAVQRFSTTTTYSVTSTDLANCATFVVSAGSPTFQLPPVPANGRCFWVINYGTGAPTIARASTETINGSAANLVISQGVNFLNPSSYKLTSDGTNWVAMKVNNGSFTQLLGGSAANQTFTVAAGSTMTTSGTGRIDANRLLTVDLPALPASPGGYLQYNGSAFAWGNPSGVGGLTAWSSLTNPTNATNILMQDQPTVLQWQMTTANRVGLNVGETAASTGANSTLMNVGTVVGSAAVPLVVTGGGTSNGMTVRPNGDVYTTGTAKFVTPTTMQLLAIPGAASLATDPSGNIVAGGTGGGGPLTLIYTTLISGTVGSTASAALSTTTLVTPTSNTSYRLEVQVKQTNTAACGTPPSISLRLSYTDGDTGAQIPGNQGGLVMFSANGNNTAASYMTFTSAAPGQGNAWYSVPVNFYAQGGQVVQITVWQQAAGASCTTSPQYTIRPYLYQINTP